MRENPFRVAAEEPVSTFSIDVDTASYSFVRASLNQNVLPQPEAVRIEEMINYFPYDYAGAGAAPTQPFRANVAVFPSPWTPGRKLIRIGIKGYAVAAGERPPRQSGLPDRHLGLDGRARTSCRCVKQSLVDAGRPAGADDRVAIVTYAGSGRHRARADAGQRQGEDPAALIEQLGAGGTTAGGEGIRQAYALAEQQFRSQAASTA